MSQRNREPSQRYESQRNTGTRAALAFARNTQHNTTQHTMSLGHARVFLINLHKHSRHTHTHTQTQATVAHLLANATQHALANQLPAWKWLSLLSLLALALPLPRLGRPVSPVHSAGSRICRNAIPMGQQRQQHQQQQRQHRQ